MLTIRTRPRLEPHNSFRRPEPETSVRQLMVGLSRGDIKNLGADSVLRGTLRGRARRGVDTHHSR